MTSSHQDPVTPSPANEPEEPDERGAAWARWAARDFLQPGLCPLCEAERTATDRQLDALLWESCTDPGVREQLRVSRGWCAHHLTRAIEIESQRGSPTGVALIYSDILEHLATDAATGAARRPACPACRHAFQAAESAAHHLARALDDGSLDENLSAAGAFCIFHLPLLTRLTPSTGKDKLLARALPVFKDAADNLYHYSKSESVDYEGPRAGRESIRALLQLVRGTYAGTSINPYGLHTRRPWYRKFLGLP